MANLYIVCEEKSPIIGWKKQVDEWITKYLSDKKEDKVLKITQFTEISTNGYDKVFVIGSNLSGLVKQIVENNKEITVIENLCYDVSVDSHRDTIDYFRLNRVNIIRDFEFLREEIISFVKMSLSEMSGEEPPFSYDDVFLSLGYSSLEIMKLMVDIEEEYNVYLPKGIFGKLWRIKELPQIIGRGQLSNYYKNEK